MSAVAHTLQLKLIYCVALLLYLTAGIFIFLPALEESFESHSACMQRCTVAGWLSCICSVPTDSSDSERW